MNLEEQHFLRKELCFAARENVQAERFIDREEAKRRFAKREPSLPGTVDITGFYFSLKILRKFMEKIDKYNLDADEQNEIAGIRIWQAKSPAFFGLNENPLIYIEDVVITPVRSDMSDVHAFPEGESVKGTRANDQLEEPLLILSSSRPCPNLCGEPLKFFHEYTPPAPLD